MSFKKTGYRQCKKCLRLRKAGAAVCAQWVCECGEVQIAGNGAHEKICYKCAVEQNRCYWCGEKHET